MCTTYERYQLTHALRVSGSNPSSMLVRGWLSLYHVLCIIRRAIKGSSQSKRIPLYHIFFLSQVMVKTGSETLVSFLGWKRSFSSVNVSSNSDSRKTFSLTMMLLCLPSVHKVSSAGKPETTLE